MDGNTVMEHGYVVTSEIPNFKGDSHILYIDLKDSLQPGTKIKIHIKKYFLSFVSKYFLAVIYIYANCRLYHCLTFFLVFKPKFKATIQTGDILELTESGKDFMVGMHVPLCKT